MRNHNQPGGHLLMPSTYVWYCVASADCAVRSWCMTPPPGAPCGAVSQGTRRPYSSAAGRPTTPTCWPPAPMTAPCASGTSAAAGASTYWSAQRPAAELQTTQPAARVSPCSMSCDACLLSTCQSGYQLTHTHTPCALQCPSCTAAAGPLTGGSWLPALPAARCCCTRWPRAAPHGASRYISGQLCM